MRIALQMPNVFMLRQCIILLVDVQQELRYCQQKTSVNSRAPVITLLRKFILLTSIWYAQVCQMIVLVTSCKTD